MVSKGEGSSHVGAQAMLPFKECLEWYRENNEALAQDDRALLQRWLDDGRATEVWSAIRAYSEQHDGPIGVDAPMYLIAFVLQLKKAAEKESEANADIAAKTAELRRLKTEFTRQVPRVAKQLPFEKRAKVWEFASKALSGLPPIHVSPPRVRSDRKGSRARTYFIRDLSALVHDLTGRWLHDQVAVITDIAFGTDDIVSSDTIRRARSQKGKVP